MKGQRILPCPTDFHVSLIQNNPLYWQYAKAAFWKLGLQYMYVLFITINKHICIKKIKIKYLSQGRKNFLEIRFLNLFFFFPLSYKESHQVNMEGKFKLITSLPSLKWILSAIISKEKFGSINSNAFWLIANCWWEQNFFYKWNMINVKLAALW